MTILYNFNPFWMGTLSKMMGKIKIPAKAQSQYLSFVFKVYFVTHFSCACPPQYKNPQGSKPPDLTPHSTASHPNTQPLYQSWSSPDPLPPALRYIGVYTHVKIGFKKYTETNFSFPMTTPLNIDFALFHI